MKKTLPLMAALATLPLMSAPVAAQDMSQFLNPSAMAADLGLTRGHVHAPRSYALATPRVAVATPIRIAPVTSLRPVIRPASITRLRVVETHPETIALRGVVDEVSRAAPLGANTAVIITDQPVRRTLWQRLFGG
ncbi:hypothetical protein V8J82_01195 [Gymnodinialimonas sp. 2305UL16-5]|uniref:hypothetical protein n=1 Tax=Gymnodinialimonas mytili TaxID=3126503 RepID=UPI0030AF0B3D